MGIKSYRWISGYHWMSMDKRNIRDIRGRNDIKYINDIIYIMGLQIYQNISGITRISMNIMYKEHIKDITDVKGF